MIEGHPVKHPKLTLRICLDSGSSGGAIKKGELTKNITSNVVLDLLLFTIDQFKA
jgi:hypothetical protein